MERIMIIGCGGSGKTTLDRQLGQVTGIPVVHLDNIFWSPGDWKHLEKEEFDIRLQAELEKPRWIMDGNYDRTLETRLQKADAVIWLDYPRWVCLFSWIKRVMQNRGTARADMAPGCNEWFDPEMARWIWNFNKENRSRYLKLLSGAQGKTVYILKSRKQARKFVENANRSFP